MHAFPKAAQVACFDTAFHRAHPYCQPIPLPCRAAFTTAVSAAMASMAFPTNSSRAASSGLFRRWSPAGSIVAHLGNGASPCGIRDGRADRLDDGFHPAGRRADGHALRPIDPGVVLLL